MSYLRLNACLRVLGDADRLANIMIDPDTVEGLLKVMLADKVDQLAFLEMELGEADMSQDVVDEILIWVRDHLAYFFMKRFQQLADQGQKLGTVADHLKSSLTGSGPSTFNGAPAGPSE